MIQYVKSYSSLSIVLAADVLTILSAYYLAYLIRFDFEITNGMFIGFNQTIALVLLVKITAFTLFKLYKGMWRFTSITDLFNVIKACSVSSMLLVLFLLFLNRFEGLSRSVFVIDWILTLLMVAGFRIFIRIYYEGRFKVWMELILPMLRTGSQVSPFPVKKRLLIVGAGKSGEKIYREIQDNPQLSYQVLGFVDDHPGKKGKSIHGKTVLGSVDSLHDLTRTTGADEIIIAISSATSKQMRRIINHCKASKLPYKTIPGMGEIISGDVSIQTLREVSYNDLLGRDHIRLDEALIQSQFTSSRVLVTGAGGSIGSELCRQICRFAPRQLILFDRAETPLYEIDMELRHLFPGLPITPVLADIQYPDQIEAVFKTHTPDVVLHAAAYKHVPMMEGHPWKAVKNNIIGTQNLVATAVRHQVKRFVLVSTDKAVRPTNVMGATKRIAELLVLNRNHMGNTSTRFMAVRFGNVVGSAGSVLPLFKKQIKVGGPVTVTHRNMTRYFMTIPEAAQLILQAGAMGEGGEIFILDMGEPVKIDALARDFIKLSGLEPGVDIDIEYIGLRPGEKLYEELITEGEGIVPTNHHKIMVLRGKANDLKALQTSLNDLCRIAQSQESDPIRKKLCQILPEYTPLNGNGISLPDCECSHTNECLEAEA
ncbi:MAG: polysaccharide biosynthesis protein [Desulfobacterales bacterium]|nr:polysaccharide biosynthesis protein [Desulfobacterales bacterium]